jgi:hypothetical protein
VLEATLVAAIATAIRAVASVIVAWVTLRLAGRPNDDLDRRLLGLMDSTEEQRYEQKWAAQLHDLLRDNELRQARRDRRCIVVAAIAFSLMFRLSRALSRAR